VPTPSPVAGAQITCSVDMAAGTIEFRMLSLLSSSDASRRRSGPLAETSVPGPSDGRKDAAVGTAAAATLQPGSPEPQGGHGSGGSAAASVAATSSVVVGVLALPDVGAKYLRPFVRVWGSGSVTDLRLLALTPKSLPPRRLQKPVYRGWGAQQLLYEPGHKE
jgi:hypothetical protein